MARRLLTADMIAEATGQQDLEDIEHIEIIFGSFEELGALEGCTKLRSLTVINAGMTRISALQPVASTLEKLCLCDQGITRMEGLTLPNLRELLLHQNALTRIEGLDGCPRLQKLWLFSNRIAKLEGLHGCPELRELWVQDNRLRSLHGLSSLSSLQVLALAANRVSDFAELQRLAALPALRDLSLGDEHFGECPIVAAPGYWNFVLCTLKQVTTLDGAALTARGRREAEDAYAEQALRFSERVSTVRRENVREMQAIEARQRRSERHADVMKRELLDAFSQLERLVLEGRQGMASEHTRQKRVRDENLRVLDETLASLRGLHARELDARIATQSKRLAEETRLYSVLEGRAVAEREQALLVAALGAVQPSSESTAALASVACQQLAEHSPDSRLLSTLLHARQPIQEPLVSPGAGGLSRAKAKAKDAVDAKQQVLQQQAGCPAQQSPLMLLRGFRVFNGALQRAFTTASLRRARDVERGPSAGSGMDAHAAQQRSELFFYGGSRAQLQALLCRGLSASGVGLAEDSSARGVESGVSESLVLFSDPALAARLLSRGARHSVLGVHDTDTEVHGLSSPRARAIGADEQRLFACESDAADSRVTVSEPTAVVACQVEGLVTELAPVNIAALAQSNNSAAAALDSVTVRAPEPRSENEVRALVSELAPRARAAGAAARFVGNSADHAAVEAAGTVRVEYARRGGAGSGTILIIPQRTTMIPAGPGDAPVGDGHGSTVRSDVLVVPEYHLLCAPTEGGSSATGSERSAHRRLEALMRELLDPLASDFDLAQAQRNGHAEDTAGDVASDSKAASLLRRFEAQSAEEVSKYERRVEQEMDPESAARMQQVDEETRQLQEEMQALRTQIDTEKAMQEQILRDFRHQLAATGGGGGGGDMV
eukprot:g2182.t1